MSAFQCPECGTPLQRLSDRQGKPKGTLEDALAAHMKVVHKK